MSCRLALGQYFLQRTPVRTIMFLHTKLGLLRHVISTSFSRNSITHVPQSFATDYITDRFKISFESKARKSR